jgi:CRP-like cAMP-binding protein
LAKSTVPPRPSVNRRPENHLLRALSQDAYERLAPDLKTIKSTAKRVFHKNGAPVSDVYFPNGGVVSSTAVLADGTMIETATIGREGMVGIEAFFGDHPIAPGERMMQVPDTNIEMLSVVAFRRKLARQGSLATLMGRYAQAAVALLMQSAACNARHHVHERCCRWLLMTHDRVGQDRFTLSQEFLAMMLGVSRQSVTIVAGTLQRPHHLQARPNHGRRPGIVGSGLVRVLRRDPATVRKPSCRVMRQ